MQSPPFGPGNFVLSPSPVFFRQGPGPGIGVVPQVDPGNIGKLIREFSPNRQAHSLSMGHFAPSRWLLIGTVEALAFYLSPMRPDRSPHFLVCPLNPTVGTPMVRVKKVFYPISA